MKNTVLIVDDAPVDCEVLKAIVTRLGYKAVVCHDGFEALQYIKTHGEVLMVLLDIYMPNVDGISALGNLKKHYPKMPVVIVSGSEDDHDAAVTKKLGAAGYLKKPVPLDELSESIKQLIEKAKRS